MYAYPCNSSLLFHNLLLMSSPCLLILLAELKVLFLLKCPGKLLRFCLGHGKIQLCRQRVPMSRINKFEVI